MSYKEIAIRFWNNVNAVRLKKGMTWAAVGELMGTSAQSLITMKQQSKTPSIGYAVSLAESLDVSPEELCFSDMTDAAAHHDKSMVDVLSVVAGKLSDEDVLLLVLIAQQMIDVHHPQTVLRKDKSDQKAVEDAANNAAQNAALMEKLKKRYL